MSFLARIGSSLGLTERAPRATAASVARVVEDQPLWSQHTRIGVGLTPREVTNIIRVADTGDMTRLMDLANESRQKDCHLHSVLATSEESLTGLAWRVVAPENPSSKERKIAQWVDDELRHVPTLPHLIGHMAGAVYYGRAVAETLWVLNEGKLVPGEFITLSPRRFSFRPSDGKLVWRDVGMPIEGIDFVNAFPNKFVLSQPRVNGDVPHREGLCRVLVWAALFRNWTFTDWLRTGETSWKPWRIATYNKQAGPEDKAGLERVLRQLTTDGAGLIPDTTRIDISWPGGSTGRTATHAELANILAQEMSKAVLGQTETVQASSASGYAQAKVHDAIRRDLLEARARQVAHEITRDIIVPMMSFNVSENVRAPRFEFITQDTVDLEKYGRALRALTEAGLIIPQKWARDQGGIPEPKDGEPVLEPLRPVGMNAPAGPDGGPDEETPAKPKPAPKTDPETES